MRAPWSHFRPTSSETHTQDMRRAQPCVVSASHPVVYISVRGALAQLGERLVCNQEVAGSIPVRSIYLRFAASVGGSVSPRDPVKNLSRVRHY
jgi:hypothetical protein